MVADCLLVAGRWWSPFADRCSLSAVHCSLSAVRCSLFAILCSLFAVRYSLFAGCWSVAVGHWSPFTGGWSLIAGCSSLDTVRPVAGRSFPGTIRSAWPGVRGAVFLEPGAETGEYDSAVIGDTDGHHSSVDNACYW